MSIANDEMERVLTPRDVLDCQRSYSAQQLATLLGVDEALLQKAIHKGEFDYTQGGDRPYGDAALRWLRQHEIVVSIPLGTPTVAEIAARKAAQAKAVAAPPADSAPLSGVAAIVAAAQREEGEAAEEARRELWDQFAFLLTKANRSDDDENALVDLCRDLNISPGQVGQFEQAIAEARRLTALHSTREATAVEHKKATREFNEITARHRKEMEAARRARGRASRAAGEAANAMPALVLLSRRFPTLFIASSNPAEPPVLRGQG